MREFYKTDYVRHPVLSQPQGIEPCRCNGPCGRTAEGFRLRLFADRQTARKSASLRKGPFSQAQSTRPHRLMPWPVDSRAWFGMLREHPGRDGNSHSSKTLRIGYSPSQRVLDAHKTSFSTPPLILM